MPRPAPDLRATLAALDIATTGNRLATCPICGGARTAQAYARRVHCFHDGCGAQLTARDLVAHHLGVSEPDAGGCLPPRSPDEEAKVDAWFAANPVAPARGEPKVDPSAARAPHRRDVERLWAAAGAVTEDPSVCRWLTGKRRLDAAVIAALDLARTLPAEADTLAWASAWRKGHRLLVPTFGPTGQLEGVRARWTLLKPAVPAKAISPAWGSGAASGCVLANHAAVRMLQGLATRPTTILVVEGEPDFLTWATARPDLPVIGIWQGAWTAEFARRIPAGSIVILRTHHDTAGEKYAAIVASSLDGRVKVLRSKACATNPTRDENDALAAGALPADPASDVEPFALPPSAARYSSLPSLRRDGDGKPYPDRENAITMLTEHAVWRGRVWLNTFDAQIYVGDHPVSEGVKVEVMVAMTRAAGVGFQKRAVEEALTFVARENRRHPVADWLRSLTWDGRERLHRLLPDYFGTADDELHQRLGRLWAIGAVSRPLAPGNKLDHTLVLVGKQGTGKSTAVEALAVKAAWFNDTPGDLRMKDARIALQGTWLMELAELDSLRRIDLSAMKAFLTDTVDRFRPPYARADETFPRSTVFVGTSNEHEILRDPTGNRRFWPVITGAIAVDQIRSDREQLWAEAVRRFDEGVQWWPDAALERSLNAHRGQFELTDPWLGPVMEWVRTAPGEFTIQAVLTEALGLLPKHDYGRAHEMRVAKLLRGLGYQPGPKRRKGGQRLPTWVKATK